MRWIALLIPLLLLVSGTTVDQTCRVLAVGDSITASPGQETSWRSYADDGTMEWVGPTEGAGTRFGGAGGITSTDLVSQFPKWVDVLRPDVGLILIGSNDIRLGTPPQTTVENISSMVDHLHASGARAVVGTVSMRYDQPKDVLGPEHVDVLNNLIIQDVPAEVRVIDLPKRLTVDGVHPNEAGKRYIANVLAPSCDD